MEASNFQQLAAALKDGSLEAATGISQSNIQQILATALEDGTLEAATGISSSNMRQILATLDDGNLKAAMMPSGLPRQNLSESKQILAALEDGNLEAAMGLIPPRQHLSARFGSRSYTLLHYACYHGNETAIQSIISQSMDMGRNLNALFRRHPTPIDVARENHHDNIVSFLTGMVPAEVIEAAAKDSWTKINDCSVVPYDSTQPQRYQMNIFDSDENQSQMSSASLNWDSYKLGNFKELTAGGTQLHMAAFEGNLSEVRKIILEGGNDMNDLDNEGRSPLIHAAHKGHCNVVEFFTSKDCDLAICDKNGRSALHYATHQGHSDVVNILLKGGCDPMIKDSKGITSLHIAAYNGYVDIFKLLAQQPGCKPSVPDGSGRTCVHVACQQGYLPILELLIQTYNCSVNEKDKQDETTGLHLAASKGHIVIMKFLHSQETCDFEANDLTLKTPLHRACQYDQLQSVKYLVEQANCNPIAQDRNGATPLHVAALNGNTAIVKYLLSIPGLDCSLVDDNYKRTVLHYASQHGSPQIVKLLLEKCNLDLNHGDSQNGIQPIHLAANNGNLALLLYLCTLPGANPDVGDSHGRTPLFYACQNGHLNAAKYLIKKHKCDLNKYDSKGVSCAMIASRFGHDRMIEQLKEICSEIDEEKLPRGATTKQHFWLKKDAAKFSFFARAMAVKGDLRKLKEIIRNNNLDVKTDKGPNGELILHNASFAGNLNVVKYLVDECGCDFTVRDNDSHTSIHNAAHEGFTEIIEFFSHHKGFEVDIADKTDRTPLHYAAQNGHFNAVQLLVKQLGCTAFYPDVRNVIPFQLAAGNGHMEILKLFASLPEAKEKMHALDSAGRSAVHDASQYGRLETVKFLVKDCGLSATTRGTKMGTTPLSLAAGNGFLPLVEFFCSLDEYTMDEADDHGRTPLHYACQEDRLEVIKYLVAKRKCNPSLLDEKGISPLHLSLVAGSDEAVKFLSQYSTGAKPANGDVASTNPAQGFILHAIAFNGNLDKLKAALALPEVDPDTKGINGATPLHLAALKGHLKIVEYLVNEHKVDVNATDHVLHTPFLNACYNGHLKVAKFLVEAQCQTESKDENGRTPLHFACQNGHNEVVKFLVDEVECEISASDKDGTTPFQLAAFNGKEEIAKFLANKGCDTVAIDSQGRTSLHCACQEGHLNMVKFLVDECKIDVYRIDSNNGIMGIHLAAGNGHIGIVKFLCSLPEFDPDILDNNHRSSLHFACKDDRLNVVQYLVEEHNCNLNLEDDAGFTPAFLASMSDSSAVIEYLTRKAENEAAGITTNMKKGSFEKLHLTSKPQSSLTEEDKHLDRCVEKQKKRIENRMQEYEHKKPPGIIFIVGIFGAEGTDIDVNNIEQTFEDLNFATFIEKDPLAEDVFCLIKAAASINWPALYRFQYVAFYFAGHGGMNADGEKFICCLQVQNKSEVLLINKHIIDPLSCLHKKKISRIFLFDCCQSKGTGVPLYSARGNSEPGEVTPFATQNKGKQHKCPGELIAYATSKGKKAWGDRKTGGTWTYYLCKNIREMPNQPFVSVVLKTDANVTSELKANHDIQQPVVVISAFGDKHLSGKEPAFDDQMTKNGQSKTNQCVEKHKKRIENRMQEYEHKKPPGIIFIVGIFGAEGTDIDVNNIKQTFEDLNFATFIEKDPLAEDVFCLIKAAASIDWPALYRFQYVAFYFAGHGGMNADGEKFICCLQVQNKSEVLLINEHIIDPLSCLHKKKISRIFLFDCCQSKGTGVPLYSTRGNSEPGEVTPFATQNKGKQHKRSGELIAYAISKGKKAWGDRKTGGTWTYYLCKNIREMPNQPFVSVVLKTDANVTSELKANRDIQQPVIVISAFGFKHLSGKEPAFDDQMTKNGQSKTNQSVTPKTTSGQYISGKHQTLNKTMSTDDLFDEQTITDDLQQADSATSIHEDQKRVQTMPTLKEEQQTTLQTIDSSAAAITEVEYYKLLAKYQDDLLKLIPSMSEFAMKLRAAKFVSQLRADKVISSDGAQKPLDVDNLYNEVVQLMKYNKKRKEILAVFCGILEELEIPALSSIALQILEEAGLSENPNLAIN